jgi:hypothetical protein
MKARLSRVVLMELSATSGKRESVTADPRSTRRYSFLRPPRRCRRPSARRSTHKPAVPTRATPRSAGWPGRIADRHTAPRAAPSTSWGPRRSRRRCPAASREHPARAGRLRPWPPLTRPTAPTPRPHRRQNIASRCGNAHTWPRYRAASRSRSAHAEVTRSRGPGSGRRPRRPRPRLGGRRLLWCSPPTRRIAHTGPPGAATRVRSHCRGPARGGVVAPRQRLRVCRGPAGAPARQRARPPPGGWGRRAARRT